MEIPISAESHSFQTSNFGFLAILYPSSTHFRRSNFGLPGKRYSSNSYAEEQFIDRVKIRNDVDGEKGEKKFTEY